MLFRSMTLLDNIDDDLIPEGDDEYDANELSAKPQDEFDEWTDDDEDKPKGTRDLRYHDDKEE